MAESSVEWNIDQPQSDIPTELTETMSVEALGSYLHEKQGIPSSFCDILKGSAM